MQSYALTLSMQVILANILYFRANQVDFNVELSPHEYLLSSEGGWSNQINENTTEEQNKISGFDGLIKQNKYESGANGDE